MIRRPHPLLLLLLLASACQAGGPTAGKQPTPTKALATSLPASPAVGSSAKPATPTPGGASVLLKPSSASTTLSGTILIDSGYAATIAQSGRLLANGGAPVLAMGGGKVLANDGATVLANDGATLVAAGAGNVLANDGATVLANDGATILANDGATVLANDGATILANDGATYRTAFGLLADAPPVLGHSVAAAGMVVYVVSLATNQVVPLGVDAHNKPVYTVYSNNTGAFTLYLPASLKGQAVRLMAIASGSTDPRLTYNVLAAVGQTAPQAVTENLSLLGSFERRCLLERLEAVIGQPGYTDPLFGQLQAAVIAAGLPNQPAATKAYVAQVLADRILALAGQLDADLALPHPDSQIQATRAIPAVTGLFNLMLVNTATLLNKDPHFFDHRPYMLAANRARAAAGQPPFQIEKPRDIGEFIVDAYLGSTQSDQRAAAGYVEVDLGFSSADGALLTDAGTSMVSVALGVLANPDNLNKAMADLPAVLAAAARPRAVAPLLPVTTPAPLALTVSSFGSGNAYGDGPAATAGFESPCSLALDAQGRLLVVDEFAPHVRRIDLQAAGQPVSTLLSSFTTFGSDQVPGAWGIAVDSTGTIYLSDTQANTITRFGGAGTANETAALVNAGPLLNPHGLALDAAGNLYVADTGNHRVQKIAHPDTAAATVTTVAGSQAQAGFLLGPALQAGLNSPQELAFDTDGSLLIVDTLDARVRRLGPEGFLDVFVGTGVGGLQEGFWDQAQFKKPDGIALFKGDVVLADTGNDRLDRVTRTQGLETGDMTTLAGTGNSSTSVASVPGGFVDGPALTASFHGPSGMVADDTHLYVADVANHRIRVLQ